MEEKSIIGQHVKYYDYLGTERFGNIAAFEPAGNDLAWIYIVDEDPNFNDKVDLVNGVQIQYAEVRISTEVYIDE